MVWDIPVFSIVSSLSPFAKASSELGVLMQAFIESLSRSPKSVRCASGVIVKKVEKSFCGASPHGNAAPCDSGI